ncbi:MAG: DNA polymerase Y family protein [Paracoccaceae bacterium]
MTGAMARRVIVAALPCLAAEQALRREGRSGHEAPFALVARAGGALRLVSVNAPAARAGLAPGLALADARARAPCLATRRAEPARFDAGRGALELWAGRFSPTVGRDRGADEAAHAAGFGAALVIDATGCAHLWGGEAGMLDALLAGLDRLGLTAGAAIADGCAAAWALAHYGRAPSRCRPCAPSRNAPHALAGHGDGRALLSPPGRARDALAALPVAALRLDAGEVAALASVGLCRIGELSAMPRAQIARRFGVEVVRRLDRALGVEPEPVAPRRPLPRFAVRLTLPEPIGRTDDVMAGLARLTARLCDRLDAAGAGARAVRLVAGRVDGEAVSAEVRLARPTRGAARLTALFAPRVETMEAGFGIDALRLEAIETEPRVPVQTGIVVSGAGQGALDDPHRRETAFADLIDRLAGRLGAAHLQRLVPAGGHCPAGEFRLIPIGEAGQEAADWPAALAGRPALRPLVLIAPEPVAVLDPPLAGHAGATRHPPPARFRWRRRAHRTVAVAGPERIAPAWWRPDPAWAEGPRDYWRVTTEAGLGLWLYRTPAAERPGWWCHGLFA